MIYRFCHAGRDVNPPYGFVVSSGGVLELIAQPELIAKRGGAHAYTAVLDDAGVAADRMRAMPDTGGDHAVVLSRFLRTLTPEDEATVAQLLDELRRSGDA